MFHLTTKFTSVELVNTNCLFAPSSVIVIFLESAPSTDVSVAMFKVVPYDTKDILDKLLMQSYRKMMTTHTDDLQKNHLYFFQT